MILSQVNSMYDLLGLAGPFTVQAKILMQHLWANSEKFDRDDLIPEENKQHWSAFFNALFEINQVRFERCLKPSDTVCNPVLVIFCLVCTMATTEQSNLIVSKNRLPPTKKPTSTK